MAMVASSHGHSLRPTDNSEIPRIPGPIESSAWSQVLACHWSTAANTGLSLAGSWSLLSASWPLIGWCWSSYGQESSSWHLTDMIHTRDGNKVFQEIEIILKRTRQRMSWIFLRDEQNLFRLRGILTQPVSKPTCYYNEAQNNAS